MWIPWIRTPDTYAWGVGFEQLVSLAIILRHPTCWVPSNQVDFKILQKSLSLPVGAWAAGFMNTIWLLVLSVLWPSGLQPPVARSPSALLGPVGPGMRLCG